MAVSKPAEVRGKLTRAKALLKRLNAREGRVRKRIARYRRQLAAASNTSKPCPHPFATITSAKNWSTRPIIKEDLFVLHSTESLPGSGAAVANFLANKSTQADVHDLVDANGRLYALVPHKRKAWHVVNFNSRARGVEQVGHASQTHWPVDQLDTVARLIACWSRETGNPIRDARGDLTKGVVTHSSLGAAGGGHSDPGTHYPFNEVLALARKYR